MCWSAERKLTVRLYLAALNGVNRPPVRIAESVATSVIAQASLDQYLMDYVT